MNTEACVRGCSIYGEHFTDCEDREACRGCLPRRARHGHLCDTCHRRLQLMLTDAPGVIRWLTGNLTSGDGASRAKEDHERRRGGGANEKGLIETPAPIKVDILDTRDLLRDRLTLWVDDWCEFKGLTGPERHTPDVDAAYLLTWLHGICSLDWIGDWWQEMAETMSQAHALAPWRPTMRRIRKVPCPGCGETNLAIFGGEEDVSCLSCSIIMTSDRFEMWERVLKLEREAEAS